MQVFVSLFQRIFICKFPDKYYQWERFPKYCTPSLEQAFSLSRRMDGWYYLLTVYEGRSNIIASVYRVVHIDNYVCLETVIQYILLHID